MLNCSFKTKPDVIQKLLIQLFDINQDKTLVSRDELSDLFEFSIKNGHYLFTQILYCVNANLDINLISNRTTRHSSAKNMRNQLIEITNGPVNNNMIEVVLNGADTEVLINFINKIDLFERGSEIIKNKIDYSGAYAIFYQAILSGKTNAVDYLLKNFNISPQHFYFINELKLPPILFVFSKQNHIAVSTCHEMLKCFIEHDPSCVHIKDYAGRHILWYLKDYKESLGPINKKDSIKLAEIETMIHKVYGNYFLFFSANSNQKSDIPKLDIDIMNSIYGMYGK
jgi:hypothetical protein